MKFNAQPYYFFMIIAASYLLTPTNSRQIHSIQNQIDGKNSLENNPTIKIDPVLRKALLKALEKLEKKDSLPSTTTTTSKPPETNEFTTAPGTGSAENKAEEVQFFTAPLVAAFTVQQDHSGIPKAVIPIFKQKPLIQEYSEANVRFRGLRDNENLSRELRRLQEEYERTQLELKQTKEFIEKQRLLIEPHLERTVITSVQRLPTNDVFNFNGEHDRDNFNRFSNNRVQRQESGVGNYLQNIHESPFDQTAAVFNRPVFNQRFNEPPQFVDQRLKRLLYFSGFGNAHDDLNIVSKVLSLNHYSSDNIINTPKNSFINHFRN